jgi:exopolysaccharide biosynthesis protein
VKKVRSKVSIALATMLSLLTASAGLYGYRLTTRPAREPMVRSLFQGVTYERYVRDQPRPLLFHLVTVDLTAAGIDFLVSPPQPADEKFETSADTVPGFLKRQQVQVAVNGSYFFPHYVRSPFTYYPHVGDGASTMGVSISNGDRYSEAEEGWAALCIISNRDIRISERDCPAETQQAIAGDIQFVKGGQLYTDGLVILQGNDVNSMPRTAIAINRQSTQLWMVVVDGRQKGYSEGITLAELGEFLIGLGADRAINLDGGGSSTLAAAIQGQPTVLNAPFQARVPMNLRPVANQLGLYARPLTP